MNATAKISKNELEIIMDGTTLSALDLMSARKSLPEVAYYACPWSRTPSVAEPKLDYAAESGFRMSRSPATYGTGEPAEPRTSVRA